MPSRNRPPHAALADAACCAITTGWRGHVGTTAMPSWIVVGRLAGERQRDERDRSRTPTPATSRRSPAPRCAPRASRATVEARASRGTAARASFDVGRAERAGEVAAVEHELGAVADTTTRRTTRTRPSPPPRRRSRRGRRRTTRAIAFDRIGARAAARRAASACRSGRDGSSSRARPCARARAPRRG